MNCKSSARLLWGTVGILVLFALILFLTVGEGFRDFLKQKKVLLGIEPRYEGKRLSYWTEHGFQYSGGRKVTDPDAAKALEDCRSDQENFPRTTGYASAFKCRLDREGYHFA